MSTTDTASAREEFKRLVILGNHPECKTYEEALEKEFVMGAIINHGLGKESKMLGFRDGDPIISLYGGIATKGTYHVVGLPITIGRVMQALRYSEIGFSPMGFGSAQLVTWDGHLDAFVCGFGIDEEGSIEWLLTKDGRECTDDSQTDETITALLEILKKN